MEALTLTHNHTLSSISRTALKNYQTYVNHYKTRNLIPMTFEDFLKNYMR